MDEFASLELVVDDLKTWSLVVDDPDLPRVRGQAARASWEGRSLGAPIVVDGSCGASSTRPGRPASRRSTTRTSSYLEALVAILAGAVSRALREESLEHLAYRDPLTGLQNRRALDEHATEEFTVCAGASRTITVVTIDINRLKQVNDTLGHVAGDQLIQAVAHDLHVAFSRLPGCDGRARRRRRVHRDGQRPGAVPGHQPLRRALLRTWRFGPGVGRVGRRRDRDRHGPDHGTPTDLFAAADRAQYVAKRGRLSSTVMAEDCGASID